VKTFKFLIVVCIIFAFSTNNASSQKVVGEQTISWYLTPGFIPCLTEVVFGDIVEIQSFTNKTYHVKPRGVLYGATSGDEYEMVYEYNQFVDWRENGGSFHCVFPIVLKHEGKLVAVIHGDWMVVYNANWVLVKQRSIDNVNCK
jgi:hypothetical protein